MSRAEADARLLVEPMITGRRRVTLTAREQETVAFWLSKTAMTLHLARPDLELGLIPLAHYSELSASRRPVSTSQVWIGACSHDKRPAEFSAPLMSRCRITPIRRYRPTDISDESPLLPAYSVALSLGSLATLIFGHQYLATRGQLHFSGVIGAALVQIWPVLVEPIEWPGRHALSYREFDGLTESFAKYS